MRYVLIFWWVYIGGDSSTHVNVYPYTYETLSECRKAGREWLELPTQLQKPLAYTCEIGEAVPVPQQVR